MFKKKLPIEQYAYLVMAFGIVILTAFLLLAAKTVMASTIDDFETYNSGLLYGQGSNWIISENASTTISIDEMIWWSGRQGLYNHYEGGGATAPSLERNLATSTEGFFCYYYNPDSTGSVQDTTIDLQYGGNLYMGIWISRSGTTPDYKLRYNGSTGSVLGQLNASWNRICYQYDGNQVDFIINGEFWGTYTTGYSAYDSVEINSGRDEYIDFIVDDISDVGAEPEIVEFDNGYDFVQIGNPELSIHDVACFNGVNCYLELKYGFDHIGENVVIYQTDSSGGNSTFFATTTLPSSIILEEQFLLGDEVDGTVEYYRAYLVDSLTPSNIARVVWWDEEDYEDNEYFLTDACSDMSTTTWEFWNPTTWAGGMGYAIECSFRKTMYWAFTVKPSTYLKLENAKEEITKEFPFNIFYVGSALVDIASSSATSTWSIPVNWVASGSTSTLATLNFSNETVQSDYGVLWEKWLLMQTIVFYAFGFGVIWILALRILKIGSNNDDI